MSAKQKKNSSRKVGRNAGKYTSYEANKKAALRKELQNKLSSCAFVKAQEIAGTFSPSIEAPVYVQELKYCILEVDAFIAAAKKQAATALAAEKQQMELDAAQAWVTTQEAKNYSAKKQKRVLELANKDVDAARQAALKLQREFLAARKQVQEPKLGAPIQLGVSTYYAVSTVEKQRKVKKQKPILRSNAKKGSGFAPKQVVIAEPTADTFITDVSKRIEDKAIVTKVAKEYVATYRIEWEVQKQAFLAKLNEERRQQEAAKAQQHKLEQERKARAAELKRIAAAEKKAARKAAAEKARADFEKFATLYRQALVLLNEAANVRSVDKQLNKRISELENALEADFFTLKKKFDFALSCYNSVMEAAA